MLPVINNKENPNTTITIPPIDILELPVIEDLEEGEGEGGSIRVQLGSKERDRLDSRD